MHVARDSCLKSRNHDKLYSLHWVEVLSQLGQLIYIVSVHCFFIFIQTKYILNFILDCKVNYHHNFRIVDKQRIYNCGIPDILQIGEHQFAETSLINQWITMMLFSWTSASNCARIYNTLSLSFQNSIPWPFGQFITSNQVYDAFTLLSLLEDCQLRKSALVVPHKGSLNGANRFTEAVCERNVRYQLMARPEVLHYCTKCTRFLPGDVLFFLKHVTCSSNNILHLFAELKRKVLVVVIDGVCIGHPCCGIAHCKVPLNSNRDRFCPVHSSEDKVCTVVDCTNPVTSRSKVCHLVKHQQTERMHNIQGQSCFQLKERLKCAQFVHPSDPLPLLDAQALVSNTDATTNSTNESEPVNEPDLDPIDQNGEVHFELIAHGHTIPATTNNTVLPTGH